MLNDLNFNPQFQIGLNVSKMFCLVIGGCNEAEEKTVRLIAAKATITVIAPAITIGLQQLHSKNLITYKKRNFRQRDLRHIGLIINTERHDKKFCKKIFLKASKKRILINTYDLPQFSTISMAALVQCGHLRISISTSNASPTLARQLREDLEEILIKSKNSGELIEFLEKLGELRLLAKKSISNSVNRMQFLKSIVEGFHFKGTINLPSNWNRKLSKLKSELQSDSLNHDTLTN